MIPFQNLINWALSLAVACGFMWIGWKVNDFKDKVCALPVIGRVCQ